MHIDTYLARSLSKTEYEQVKPLTSPAKIQAYLDETPYSPDDFYRCPRRVVQDRKAHCFDGALFAAAMLARIGYPPLILELLPNAAGRRPPAGSVPAHRALGGGGKIQFRRSALPRTHLQIHPRAGDVLLRAVLQHRPRENPPRLHRPDEPQRVQHPGLDDQG